MQCPKCGYVLTPFEVDCPRCKIFDWFVSVPPEVAPTEPEGVDASAASEVDSPAAVPEVPLASELVIRDTNPNAALVPCPLCQHPVSPRALQCPNCGHPMASPSAKPEATKPVAAARPVAAVKPAASASPVPPVREIIPPPPQIVAASPPPRPIAAPTVAVSRVAAPREAPPIRVPEVRLEPQMVTETYPEKRVSYKPLVLAAFGLAVVVCTCWLIVSLSKTGRNRTDESSPLLAQASRLISQADADAARFQQTDLTPEQATASLQSRTTQYQEVQRLCQAATSSGADQITRLRDQQAATHGLHQVQADTEAQSARLLTAEIGASIALYKHETLTDTQEAGIRAKLRNSECMSFFPGRVVANPVFRDRTFIDRRGGDYYQDCWVRALKAHPRYVALTSWNGWDEQTAIEDSTDWRDHYGLACPNWYRQITKGYAYLRLHLLLHGFYYKDAARPDVYYCTRHLKLVHVPEYPHQLPTIFAPEGWLDRVPKLPWTGKLEPEP